MVGSMHFAFYPREYNSIHCWRFISLCFLSLINIFVGIVGFLMMTASPSIMNWRIASILLLCLFITPILSILAVFFFFFLKHI